MKRDSEKHKDIYISDFTDSFFQSAFKEYFAELGIEVKDWDGLFNEMTSEKGNTAIVRKTEANKTIGFIMYKPINFTSWFFEEKYGFIREFWISTEYRNTGHGSQLLKLAEAAFLEQGINSFILTTDSAEEFYLRHGYRHNPGCTAKNNDRVYIKTMY